MKRVIFSIYIDIPEEELDHTQPPLSGDSVKKDLKTKNGFLKHYQWLLQRQQQYADHIGCDYVHFTYDDYKEFDAEYKQKYPYLTTYNIVNFFKIHCMYLLKEKYDAILYLDMDVVPISFDNFFTEWDLSHGPVILINDPKVDRSIKSIRNNQLYYEETGKIGHTVRSPAAKFWNCYAMLEYEDFDPAEAAAYNTGIVGITKEHLDKLAYFDNFDADLELMCELKYDEYSMYPSWIRQLFGWDNETLWGFKMVQNDMPIQLIDRKWHFFMDKIDYIPTGTALCHVITKNFDYVRNYLEENNL